MPTDYTYQALAWALLVGPLVGLALRPVVDRMHRRTRG